MVVLLPDTSEVMVTTLASVRLKLSQKLMLDILVDISEDTMGGSLPDTSEVMVATLASVRLKLSPKLMLDILVDISVDTMVVSLPDTSEVMVTTLASVRLKLMLDICVDTMVDMLATVDSSDKLFNRIEDKEVMPPVKIHTCYFGLNKLDEKIKKK